jgi:hypothetical protein
LFPFRFQVFQIACRLKPVPQATVVVASGFYDAKNTPTEQGQKNVLIPEGCLCVSDPEIEAGCQTAVSASKKYHVCPDPSSHDCPGALFSRSRQIGWSCGEESGINASLSGPGRDTNPWRASAMMEETHFTYTVRCRTCRKQFSVQLFESHQKKPVPGGQERLVL